MKWNLPSNIIVGICDREGCKPRWNDQCKYDERYSLQMFNGK